MASNILEKNTVYAFTKQSTLPYPSDKHICYSSENSYVNSIGLNNTYQQLVDNDQYIAHRLLSMKKNQIGPVMVDQTDSQQQIYEMEDGQKFFLRPHDSTIYKKIDKTLQASITKSSYDGFSDGIIGIFFMPPDYVIISTPTQTFASSCKKIEQDGDQAFYHMANVECTDAGTSQAISLVCQCEGDTNALPNVFAGKDISSGAFGLYQLVIDGKSENSFICHLSKMYQAPDGCSMHSVFYCQSNNALYFVQDGDDYGSALCRCNVIDGKVAIRTLQQVKTVSEGSISKALLLDSDNSKYDAKHRILLFLSNGAIEWSSIGNTENVISSQLYQNHRIYDYQQLNVDGATLSTLLATSAGLQIKTSNGKQRIGNKGPMSNIAIANDIWLGYQRYDNDGINSNGALCCLKYDSNAITPYSFYQVDGEVKSVQVALSTPFAATSKSLLYLSNDSFTELLSADSQHMSCTAMAQSTYNAGADDFGIIYAAGKVGNSKILAIISSDSPEIVDTHEISGISTTKLTCDVDMGGENDVRFECYNIRKMLVIYGMQHVIADCKALVGDETLTYTSLIRIGFIDNGKRLSSECICYTPAYEYCGAIYGNDAVGLVRATLVDEQTYGYQLSAVYYSEDYSDDDDNSNVDESTNSKFKIEIQHYDFNVFDVSTDNSLMWKVIDGIFVPYLGSNNVAIVAQQNGNSTKFLQFVALNSQDGVSNELSISVGDVQTNLVNATDAIYALSSNSLANEVIAFSMQMQYYLEAFDKNSIAKSNYMLSSLAWPNVQFAPGCQAASENDSQTSVRIDYVTSNGQVSAISSVFNSSDDDDLFELSGTRIIDLQDCPTLRDIKFVPEQLTYRPCAVLVPSSSNAKLSVSMALSGNDASVPKQLDPTYFMSCIISDPALVANVEKIFTVDESINAVDAAIENVEYIPDYTSNDDLLSVQLIYAVPSDNKLSRAMLSCIKPSGSYEISISNLETCNLRVSHIAVISCYGYDGNVGKTYALLADGSSLSCVASDQMLANIALVKEFDSDICSLAVTYSSDTMVPTVQVCLSSSIWQSYGFRSGDVWAAWTCQSVNVNDGQKLARMFSLQYSPYANSNAVYSLNTFGDADVTNVLCTKDSASYALCVLNDDGIANTKLLAELPSHALADVASLVNNLQRDKNGNMLLNANDNISNLSVWNSQTDVLCSIGDLASTELPSSLKVSGDMSLSNDGSIVLWCTATNGNLSCLSCAANASALEVHDLGFNAQVTYVGDGEFPCIQFSLEKNAQYVGTFSYKSVANVNVGFQSYVQLPPEISQVSKIAHIDGQPNDMMLIATNANGSAQTLWKYDFSSNSISLYKSTPNINGYAFADGICGNEHYALMHNSNGISAFLADNALQAAIELSPYSTLGTYASMPGFKIDCLASDGANQDSPCHVFVSYYDNDNKLSSVEVTFAGLRLHDTIFMPTGKRFGGASNAVQQIGTNKYIVAASDGIYNYQFDTIELQPNDHCYKVLNSNSICALQQFYDRSIPVYVATSCDMLLSSSTGMWWNSYATVASSKMSDSIKCYLQTGPYTLFAGKCGENDQGLYFATYSYDIIDNTPTFTAESALATYEAHKNAVSSCISATLSAHIDSMHNASSPASLLNAYMPTSFPISDGFVSSYFDDSSFSISNDYIERILEGDGFGEEVKAKVSNTTMLSGTWPEVELTYIAKQWKSGIVELYIYIPSTHTYYIPHIIGLGCDSKTGTMTINNYKVMPVLAQNATHIKISILSTYFEIGNIVENTIKGNSLPLKVFKEPQLAASEGPIANMYHSYVEPSIASKIDTKTSIFDYYVANYYCFGSDAQAIKLVFDSRSKNFLKKYKTIVYHSGDANWKNPDLQSDVIVQRFLEGDNPKHLHWKIFDAPAGMFLGWSQDPHATAPDPVYSADATFSYNDPALSLNIMNLYAVWIFYEFDSNDTTIAISNNGEQTYTIAEITVDPTITFNNPNKSDLGNRLVVKFDDK